ncbi:hypothetical protein D3C80_2105270 [compost metagenome]
MELAQAQYLGCGLQLALDVVEAKQFGGQIVALESNLTVRLQQAQSLGGCHAASLMQLIQLE